MDIAEEQPWPDGVVSGLSAPLAGIPRPLTLDCRPKM
jgi:hypothetical protein